MTCYFNNHSSNTFDLFLSRDELQQKGVGIGIVPSCHQEKSGAVEAQWFIVVPPMILIPQNITHSLYKALLVLIFCQFRSIPNVVGSFILSKVLQVITWLISNQLAGSFSTLGAPMIFLVVLCDGLGFAVFQSLEHP